VSGNFGRLGTGILDWLIPFGEYLPYPVAIALTFVMVMVFIERKTLAGKYAVALGSNFEGARLSGIRVNRFRLMLFVNAGLAAGIAGVLLASKSDSGQPSLAVGGWEFSVIVAAVLGGVSLSGGRGTVMGTFAGAAIVGVIQTALALKSIDTFWQYIILGAVLIVICALDVRLKEAVRSTRGAPPPAAPPAAIAKSEVLQ